MAAVAVVVATVGANLLTALALPETGKVAPGQPPAPKHWSIAG